MDKKILILKLVCLQSICGSISYAQDFHLSQFYNAPLLINAAQTAAIETDYRVNTSYRDQWRSIGNPFNVQQASLDLKILRHKNEYPLLGAGIYYLGEKAGIGRMGYWFMGGSVSTSVKLSNKSHLFFGLKGGYGIRSVNMGAFSWDNQWNGNIYDASLPSGEMGLIPKIPMKDFGAGILYKTTSSEYVHFESGLAIDHFLKPNISYINTTTDKLKMRITGTFSADIKVRGTNKSILPKALLVKQGPHYEFTPGILYRYSLGLESHYTGIYKQSAIYFGGFYRTRDAIILTMMYDQKHYFSFGLSYDINLSRLTPSTYSMGGFEITLLHTGFIYSHKHPAVSRE